MVSTGGKGEGVLCEKLCQLWGLGVFLELSRCVCDQGVTAERIPPCTGCLCAEDRTGDVIGMYKIISDDTCFEKTAKREELRGPNVVLFGLSLLLWLNDGVLGHLIQTS